MPVVSGVSVGVAVNVKVGDQIKNIIWLKGARKMKFWLSYVIYKCPICGETLPIYFQRVEDIRRTFENPCPCEKEREQ